MEIVCWGFLTGGPVLTCAVCLVVSLNKYMTTVIIYKRQTYE